MKTRRSTFPGTLARRAALTLVAGACTFLPGTDVRAQSCYDGICASPIVCNECGDWEDDHFSHTAPPETQHDWDLSQLYPYRPAGGAGTGDDYDVTVWWRSYHRAMNRGDDGGHCGQFCALKDVAFSQCLYFWGLDGLGLQQDTIVYKGGTSARSISIGRIEGPYQNNELKWEWPENSSQSGTFNQYPCSYWITGSHHDWTSRPTDILTTTFRVYNWNGSTWNTNPDYELRWDEDDGTGNDDLDFRVSPSLPGVLPLDKAVETCLKYGSQNQRFTLHKDAVLMLCENRNLTDRCDDHLFEIWFDVQCKWKVYTPPPPPPTCSSDGELCFIDEECCSNSCLQMTCQPGDE